MVDALREKGIADESVLRAMTEVPRHLFLETMLDYMAYEDRALPIKCGQTISQPSTVAFQSALLDAKADMKVLEVGTGSGYQTAVLFYLGAEVFTIERQEELFRQAAKNLAAAGYLFDDDDMSVKTSHRTESGKLHIFLGDGFAGLEEQAPFDSIIVTCGAPEVPIPLLKQLKPGGRLVIPVDLEGQEGSREKKQILKLIVKTEDGRFKARNISRMSFVPMLKGVKRKTKQQ